MKKIIVTIDDDSITEADALVLISSVVGLGRQSRDNTCYCHICVFEQAGETITVHAEITKTGTDTFRLWKPRQVR